MKAVVVTPYYYPQIGGLENYARQLNKVLMAEEGWDIVVVTSASGRHDVKGSVDGHPVYRLATWFKLSNTPFNPLWTLRVRSIVQREHPDIILAHAPVPSLADAAVRAKGQTPFILVYHAATLFKTGSPLFNLAVRIYKLYGDTTFRKADKIFAVSEFVRDRLSLTLQRKTVVVPNAVLAGEIVPRVQPEQPTFIFIASLARSHAWKGLDQILRAFAAYRAAYGDIPRLTIVGDGDGRASYEATAQSLGIRDNVQFVGALTGAKKVDTLRQAFGMLIYPTTENDAFPTVMLEAWANGVPVIGARIGALATLIHDREDGLLCDPLQPKALAAVMHDLITMDKAARERLARSAAERTRRSYTWEIQAKRVSREARKLV